MSVTPGKDVMEVTGGSGEIFAREGTSLMDGFKNRGFVINSIQPLLPQNSNGMKRGDLVADLFENQHVTIASGPNNPALGAVGEIFGGLANVAVETINPQPPEVKRSPVPTASVPRSDL